MSPMTRVIAASLALAGWCSTAGALDIYFYEGEHRVDLLVALDELHVQPAPMADLTGAPLPLGGPQHLQAVGRFERVGRTITKYRCPRQSSVDALRKLADQLRRSPLVREVYLVCYDSPEALATHDISRRGVLTDKLVVRLRPGDDPSRLAGSHNLTLVRRLPIGDGLFVYRADSELDAVQKANALYEAGLVRLAQPVIKRIMNPRFIPDDPLYGDQWHLHNTGQGGGTPGADLNVESAWDITRGAGVIIGIVDEGLETTHPDLAPNHDDALGYDYNYDDPDPSPSCYEFHGTGVAGIAAARGNNAEGVSGAAPEATLAGIRLLGAAFDDVTEGLALSHRNDVIAIYNNSWGPFDTGSIKRGPGVAAGTAILDSVTVGRDGKGCIYVWAAGNGGTNADNANYDGYVNSRYTIGVTGTTDFGVRPDYAEPGACILVNTPSSGGAQAQTTTDLTGSCGSAAGDYRDSFGMTSGASPLGAGTVALMLAANPELTWRDVQHILVNTAFKNDPGDAGWVANGAGHWFNHVYGFGRIDAYAAVQAAQVWSNVPAEISAQDTVSPLALVPDNDPAGVTSQITFTQDIRLETVEVPVNISTTRRGDLRLELESPDGTVSVLATSNGDTNDNYDWTFTSVQHWNEHSAGTWTLRVIDERVGTIATLNSWTLRLWGTPGCPDPAADFDYDCDVDLDDFADFANCFGGSNVTTPPPSCAAEDFEIADADTDGDVDLNDFSIFAAAFTG